MGQPVEDLSTDSAYDKISKGLEIIGSISVGTGIVSIIRIPIPGTNGLALELNPRGWVPKSGSTSTVFFQSVDGKKVLRLDYGYNVKTKAIDFHWNQKGVKAVFGIADHQAAGKVGEALYKSARAFRYGGRVLIVLGLAADIASIVTAPNKWRQVAIVGGGWAGAWAGAELGGSGGGAIGFWLGSEVPILGNAVGAAAGGLIGGIAGGIGGYFGGSKAVEYVIDEGPSIEQKVGSAIEEITGKVDMAALLSVQ